LLNYLRPLARCVLVIALVTGQMAINVILGVAAIQALLTLRPCSESAVDCAQCRPRRADLELSRQHAV
jgi:hypothetical protein